MSLNCSGIRHDRQRGVTNMAIMAVVLPVLLLLFAGIMNYARMPLTRHRMIEALKDGAHGAERGLADESSALIIDGFTPAANNLCDAMKSNTQCNVSMSGAVGRQGFFSPDVARAFADKSCALASDRIRKSAVGVFALEFDSLPVQPFAVQFALVRLPVNRGTGQLDSSLEIVATSDDVCSGSSFSAASAGHPVTAASIGQTLLDGFRAQAVGAGAWRIEAAIDKPWLSSYWLVGVMHYRLARMLDVTGVDESHLIDYYVRPLEATAGIQAPGI